MYFVYLLLCGDDTIYTGFTTDVEKRIARHKVGKGARYTRARKVRRLLHVENFPTRTEALKREAAIKKLSRTAKLKLFSSD